MFDRSSQVNMKLNKEVTPPKHNRQIILLRFFCLFLGVPVFRKTIKTHVDLNVLAFIIIKHEWTLFCVVI